ncbi:YHS domain-containing (seleno)protein [Ekhidna sp.]
MKKLSILTLALAIAVACSSGSDEPKDETFNVGGVAIDGYDPVAYFEQGAAKKGVEEESVNHNGLTYYFSSTKNRLLFQESPEKYLPEYGGWCAYAIAESSTKMEPDPTMWQIEDGKLQLFYDDWMTNLTGSLKDEWNENPKEYKVKADGNWESMN